MSTAFQPERLQVARPRGEPGIIVLALSGELDAGTTLKLAQATAHVLAAEPPPEAIVLDLVELSFVSFAGLRLLHALHDEAGETRVRVVTGERAGVVDFLRASGFAAVLDCYRSRFAAITAGRRDEFVRRALASWDAD